MRMTSKTTEISSDRITQIYEYSILDQAINISPGVNMVKVNVKRLIPSSQLELYEVINPEGKKPGNVCNFMIDLDTGRIAFVIVS